MYTVKFKTNRKIKKNGSTFMETREFMMYGDVTMITDNSEVDMGLCTQNSMRVRTDGDRLLIERMRPFCKPELVDVIEDYCPKVQCVINYSIPECLSIVERECSPEENEETMEFEDELVPGDENDEIGVTSR